MYLKLFLKLSSSPLDQEVLVDVADQPLYALTKEIQINIPGYGPDKLFSFMGGLHIEQVGLKMNSQHLNKNGIEEILSIADINLAAAGHTLISAHQNCPTRYVMEVRTNSIE